jgi:hypothetical protein
MRDMFIEALQKKYEAEIAVAKATISVYMDKSVTIMNSLATLMPYDPKVGEKDNGKK